MFEEILNVIQTGIFWLLLKIDGIVYTFIDWVYQIILLLANGNILTNREFLNELINRMYIVVGVIVLFLVAYSLIRSMVNPDDALKGKESPAKVIQNVIISVVLIAITPYVFDFAMRFQTALLQQNTIGKIILGEGSGDISSEETINEGGFTIAIDVFQAFFQPNTRIGYCTGIESIDANYPDCKPLNNVTIGTYTSYYDWWDTEVIQNKNLFAIAQASHLVADESISYTFLISTAAGVFVLYVLALYCIEIAIRLVKLAFYQLIAPLPILTRIVPKDDVKKMFDNWIKATLSTYLEVFVRLGILFFAIFIIRLIIDNFMSIFNVLGENWGNVNPDLVLIAQVLVIVGIFLFVKQAPQIIKDITGLDGGKYGKALIKGAGMIAASIGGGTTATIRSFVSDKDKPLPQRLGRAFTAGLSGTTKGLHQGSKIDKFGDMPKAAGTASSNALSGRARREAAGGWKGYFGAQKDTLLSKGKNWLNVDNNDRVQEFAGNLDKDISQSQGVYKKSQDYIDAKALQTKLKNSIKDYDQAWNNILLEAQNDERTKDPTKEGYISAEELAQQNFIQRFGKSIDAMHIELNAANNTVEGIKINESRKKATSVAAGARDFVFQLQRFSDLKFDVQDAIKIKLQKDPNEAQRLINAYNNYSKFNDDPEKLYEQITLDLQSKDDTMVKKALDYIDALDMAKNYALDLQSTAAFKETVFKAKVKDTSGDKKK